MGTLTTWLKEYSKKEEAMSNPLEWPWWIQLAFSWSACTAFVMTGFAIEMAHNRRCVDFVAQGGDANAFQHRHDGLTATLFGAGLAVFLLGILGMLSKILG